MPREIPLTKGYVATIDDEDFDEVSRHKWHVRIVKTPAGGTLRYAVRMRTRSARIYLHRQILNPPSGMDVDHISGNGLDNRRCNLRVATHAQNISNRRITWAKTGFKGVDRSRWGTYLARIGINGQKKYLGAFSDPRDAARAYDRAALALHGEYACTNAMLGTL